MVCAFLPGIPAPGAPGELDPSFGGTGRVKTHVGTASDYGTRMEIQDDGKIVVAGPVDGQIALVRYNTDGSLDMTFNGSGMSVRTDGFPRGVALQNDGKIVVVGRLDGTGFRDTAILVVRYQSDGTLDSTFNGTGAAAIQIVNGRNEATGVAVKSDGRIVVSGYWSDHIEGAYPSGYSIPSRFAVLRLMPDGSLDPTFHGTGKVTVNFGGDSDAANAVALRSDGRIVATGYASSRIYSAYHSYRLAVARLNDDGSLDQSFNGTGTAVSDEIGTDGPLGATAEYLISFAIYGWQVGSAMALQSDGRIVTASTSAKGFTIVRFTDDGVADPSFNGNGKATVSFNDGSTAEGHFNGGDYPDSVAIQSDGKIVVAGTSYAKYSIFPSFSKSYQTPSLARLNSDGSLDTSFNATGKVPNTAPNTWGNGPDYYNSVKLQGDGKIVVAGHSDDDPAAGYNFEVARYLNSGNPIPYVATAPAGELSSRSATLNGTVNPNGQAATAYFEYGPTSSHGGRSRNLDVGSDSNPHAMSLDVGGLTPGTQYHFRLVVTNADGSFFGDDQIFATRVGIDSRSWSSARLSATANAAAGIQTGVAHRRWWLYFYKGTDNQVWGEYWTGRQWLQTVFSTTANVDDWLCFSSRWNILYYKGTDQQLWCLYYDGSAWLQRMLSATANVEGDLAVDNDWGAVFYRGNDGTVWALYWDGFAWKQTSLGGTANVKGSIAVDDSWHAIYYRGADDHLWCYHLPRRDAALWQQTTLGATPIVGGSVTAAARGSVYYSAVTDNSPWVTYWDGSSWLETSLNSGAKMLGPTALYGTYELLYLTSNGQCEAIQWNGAAWGRDLVGDGGSSLTGGLSVHPSTGFVFSRRGDGNIMVFYHP